jgi:transglutaminase-like putative cysteine protease
VHYCTKIGGEIMKKIKKILVIVIIISVMSGLSGFAEPTNKETLSREEFCTLFIDFYEDLKGIEVETDCKEPFIDTVNESVLKAHQLGLVKGNKSRKFMPEKLISEEGAKLIFERAFDFKEETFNFTSSDNLNEENLRILFKNIKKEENWTSGAYIDDLYKDRGFLRIGYKGDNEKIRVRIEKENEKYYYYLNSEGNLVNFPLQMGAGKYEISVLVNIPGQKYAYTTALSKVVEIKDPGLNTFLNPVQPIKWDEELVSVTKEIIGNETDENKKFEKIHEYIINNISYDYDKIDELTPDYAPDPYSIYESKKGICYDYASLLAAMLRIEGIPTKLIKGYYTPSGVYHAWNEIYLNEEWVLIDSTADAYSIRAGRSVNLEKKALNYDKTYEY